MQNGGMNMLNKIYFASCGYCVNDVKFIFKDRKSKKMTFPANCFLFHHAEYGYILYDTGYSRRIYEGDFINKIYTTLNPTVIEEEETLANKLKRIDIDPNDIHYIVLSHMHPDHIGGLRDFPNAQIIVSRGVAETYKKRKKRDLIFKNQVPHDFEERLIVLEEHAGIHEIDGVSYYNYFGEDLLLLDISGHTDGQLGMYLPKGKLLLVADAYWLKEELSQEMPYTVMTKLIMSDFEKYKKSHQLIRQILSADEEIVVVSSHESISSVEEFGYVVKTYDFEKLY